MSAPEVPESANSPDGRDGPDDGRPAEHAAPPGGRARLRREPPRFRWVTVRRVERRGPRLVRVTLAGGELAGFTVDEPAASVRVLLPKGGERDLPRWAGNEFLHADGTRPVIRTFTPRRFDPEALELDVEVVLHGEGAASAWAAGAAPGAPAAVSGPGRGYPVPAGAAGFFVAGDESAIPAVSQLLEVLPEAVPVAVHLEVAEPAGRVELPDHGRASVMWHDLPPGAPPGDTLVAAVRGAELAPGTHVWGAGEAAAVQRLRRHLFGERGLARSHAWIRGYWKHGRAGDGEAGGTADP